MNDVILREVYNSVTAGQHCPQDIEEEFGTRLKSYAGVCSCVFNEHLLANYFLRKLLTKTAAFVAAQVNPLPPRDRVDFSVVRRLAQAEETACKAGADVHHSLLRGAHTTTLVSRRSSISTIVGAKEIAASRQSVLAVAPPMEPVMLIPASTVPTPFTYETAQKDFAHGFRETKTMESMRPLISCSVFPKRCRCAYRRFPKSSCNWQCRSSRLMNHSFVRGSVENRVERCKPSPTSHC